MEGLIVPQSYSNYFKNIFSPPPRNIKFGIDIDEDDYPEVEVIEIPVVKRMVFQFKKPVKLEFS